MHVIIQLLATQLQSLPPHTPIWVAISGGCDSMVLLDAVAQWQRRTHIQHPIQAIHIHHQLQAQADEWADFCRQRCHTYDIPLQIMKVTVATQGVSIEASAREARYDALRSLMIPGAICLLAHHEDDQAETLLHQCLRGAGPRGLSAMPARSDFAQGQLLRPFLTMSRQALHDYALAQQLTWINDPSNQDLRYDRNFLRLEVFPLLKQRWPSCSTTLSRSAELCAQSVSLNEQTIQQALQQCQLLTTPTLSISNLLTLSPVLQYEVVRAWLTARSFPLPQQRHWQQIQENLLNAQHNPLAHIVWNGYAARRYRDALWVETEDFYLTEDYSRHEIAWQGEADIHLPGKLGRLQIHITVGVGLTYHDHYRIRFRTSGERFTTHLHRGSHPLKKCFQEWGIAPWLRARVPLVYYGDELVAVVGYAISEQYLAKRGQKSLFISHTLC